MNRVLQTTGLGEFVETEYQVPPLIEDEICVRSVMTGVCRSDIDMMTGSFGPLPLSMQGHEGLGKVIGRGSNIKDVDIGDFVATRGEPAYADVYNVRKNEYVKVPEAHPRYILEPVACGINLINQAKEEIDKRQGVNSKMLILGSGFLAWVAYHTMRLNGFIYQVDVLGSNNLELWGDRLLLGTSDSYDVVIDVSGKYELGVDINLNNNALIIDAVGKPINKTEAESLLWKACTTIRPSPRNPEFIDCMYFAKHWIENGYLEVDSFWSRCYNRNTEWQQAFADGADRPNGYSRGYIKWD
jgi:D-arabinose 1-dehydrogenase-like Zn-dependent alcohol dehydrogenase